MVAEGDAQRERGGDTVTASRSAFRRLMDSGWPVLMARLVLGGMFVYMGVMKVGDPLKPFNEEFLKLIRQYHMLPETPAIFLNGTAIVLPWLEILCGVGLLLGLSFRGAALLLAVMLAVFTPAILMRGLAILAEQGGSFFNVAFDCGCGSGVVVTWKKLLENGGLFLLSLLVLFSASTRFSL